MGVFTRPVSWLATGLDRSVGWHRLPRPLGLLTLHGLRDRLRRDNLHDTGLVKADPEMPAVRKIRTYDGTDNDLRASLRAMGSIGTRFGRNIPCERSYPELEPGQLEPNPRVVSRELLTRERFIPAWTVNLLAAAWIQFEVHDWFSHTLDDAAPPFVLGLDGEEPMSIKRTLRDPDGDSEKPPVYLTSDSHWWDGSQLYGSNEEFASMLRADGGKLEVDPATLIPPLGLWSDPTAEAPGAANFWLGLGLLHTVFTREHNAICDRLKACYPSWNDERLYQTARLINAAVMVKIHTVEWTPAIIAHPTTVTGMRATWHGLLGERFRTRFGRLGRGDLLSGVPGSRTDHFGVPYSITEEFVAVYRMHSLLPDELVIASLSGAPQSNLPIEVGAGRAQDRLTEIGMRDALYSFGIAHPGALTLHNLPGFLQHFVREPDGEAPSGALDLGAVDLLRMRERGLPRYNEFRKLVHLTPARSFGELTANAVTARELKSVYGSIERVDLLTGLLAEPVPAGFAFGDTTFRIFLLIASRRIKSDRFFTTDYTADTYTQEGLDWIDDATMVKVLLRHYPELRPALHGVSNAFTPWVRVH